MRLGSNYAICVFLDTYDTFLLAVPDRIPDGSITASSALGGYEAAKGRLNSNSCWAVPWNKVHSSEYLQIDLGQAVLVSAVVTKGSLTDYGRVMTYNFSYTDDRVSWNPAEINGSQVRNDSCM